MTTLKMCCLHKESFYGDIVAGCLYGKNIAIGGLAPIYRFLFIPFRFERGDFCKHVIPLDHINTE